MPTIKANTILVKKIFHRGAYPIGLYFRYDIGLLDEIKKRVGSPLDDLSLRNENDKKPDKNGVLSKYNIVVPHIKDTKKQ